MKVGDPYRALAASIIAQAYKQAMGKNKKKATEARSWLLCGPGSTLPFWAGVLGHSPDHYSVGPPGREPAK